MGLGPPNIGTLSDTMGTNAYPGKTPGHYSAIPKRRDKNEVAHYVETLLIQSKSIRRQEEADWYIDLKYLTGDQWVVWDPRKMSLAVKPKRPWRIRQTINHIRPSMEMLLNVLNSRRPRPQAMPAGTTPDIRQGARAAEKLWRYLFQELDMEELLDEGASWMLATSRVIYKVGFDSTAGEIVSIPDYDNLPEGVLPGPGYEMPTREIPIGEITTDVIPTFNFHVDLASSSLRKARWCGDQSYMHVEEARHRWPKLRDNIKADAGRDVWFNYARRLLYDTGDHATANDLVDTVTVTQLHFRPDPQHPRGRMITMAGPVVVNDTEDTPIDGEFPYASSLCYRNPGSFWGQSASNLARNAQTSFNRYRSLMMEYLLKCSSNQWLVAKGAGVKRADLTDEQGHAIYYNPIGQDPIKALHPAPLPPSWHSMLQMDLTDVREQIGVTDVLRGSNPAGVRSGRSIAYLVEQNMGRHEPLVRRWERCIARIGYLWLKLAQKYYAEDRCLAIQGEDHIVEAFLLKTSDLASAKNLRIIAGSTLPESRAARRDFAMELWNSPRPLIVDNNGMPDHKRALRMMEMAAEGEVYETDDTDRSWAQEENERIAQGEQLQAALHDNHPLHAEQHVTFMRTARFRELPVQSRQMFRMHLDSHIKNMMQAGPPTPLGAPAGPPGPGGVGTDTEPRTDMRGGPE